MTEQEWLQTDDVICMLDTIRKTVSSRKFRLFSCACVRQLWHLLKDDRSRSAIKITEMYADGMVDNEKLVEAREAAWNAWVRKDAAWPAWNAVWAEYRRAAEATCYSTGVISPSCKAIQPILLRDIVGNNPFNVYTKHKLPTVNPTILSLAQSVYENRSETNGHFEKTRLSILADAIEEAEYYDNTLVEHLRSHKIHVRGCWVIDLILDKEINNEKDRQMAKI